MPTFKSMFYFYEVWSKIISYKKKRAMFTFRAIYWYDVLDDLLSTFEILGTALNWKYVLYFQKVTEVTSGQLKRRQSPLLYCPSHWVHLPVITYTLWHHFILTLTRKTLNGNSVSSFYLLCWPTTANYLNAGSFLKPVPGSPYRWSVWKLRFKRP